MLRFSFVLAVGFWGIIFLLPVYAEPIDPARLRAMQASAGRDMVNLEILDKALKNPDITPQERLFLENQFEITAANIKKKQAVIEGKPLDPNISPANNKNMEKPQTVLDAAKKIQPAQGPATTDSFTDAAKNAAREMADFLRGNDPARQRRDVVFIPNSNGTLTFKYINSSGVAENVVMTPDYFRQLASKVANTPNHGDFTDAIAALDQAEAISSLIKTAQSIHNIIARDVRPKIVDGKPVVNGIDPVFEYFSNSENIWKEIPQSQLTNIVNGRSSGAEMFRRDTDSISRSNFRDVASKMQVAQSALIKSGLAVDPLVIPPEIAKLVAEKIGYFSADMTVGRERNGANPSTYFNLVYDPITKEFIGIERVRQVGTYHTPDWASDRDFVSFTGKKPPLTAVVIPAVINEHYAPSADNALPWERGEPVKPAEYKFDVRDANELQRIISQGEVVAQEAARRTAAQKAAQAAMPKIEPPKTATVVKPKFRFFR